MRSELGDEIRLRHILDAIEEIEVYLSKVDFQSFLQDSMIRFACIKQMEIIGEASNHITEKLKSEFTNIEWAQIIGMRNVFIHEYFGIDSSVVWGIIKKDIPELKEKIKIIQFNQTSLLLNSKLFRSLSFIHNNKLKVIAKTENSYSKPTKNPNSYFQYSYTKYSHGFISYT